MQYVLICINERAGGYPRASRKAQGSDKLRPHMKAKARELWLEQTRINSAGCLGRCELGTTFVIYPEGVWYKCETTADVDHVLIEHMKKGNNVNDLVLEANK